MPPLSNGSKPPARFSLARPIATNSPWAARMKTPPTVRCQRGFDRNVGGVFIRAAHGEFVAIGLAKENRARGFEPFDSGGIVRGNVIFENLRAAGGFQIGRASCRERV